MKDEIKKQIIAIGGGGFSIYGEYTPRNSLMEQYILKQSGKTKPSICFIPTASGDNAKYIIDFYRLFGALNCKPSHLSLFELPSSNLESFILEKNIIYVGGGNTKSMIALWKEWKLDKYLKKAWESGVILAGICAGASCFFEECVTDSIPGDLTVLKCLGFIQGSCCPHYNGDKKRPTAYRNFISNGSISNGYAIDDDTALHYIDTKLERIVKSDKKGAVYKVFKDEGKVKEDRVEATLINVNDLST